MEAADIGSMCSGDTPGLCDPSPGVSPEHIHSLTYSTLRVTSQRYLWCRYSFIGMLLGGLSDAAQAVDMPR